MSLEDIKDRLADLCADGAKSALWRTSDVDNLVRSLEAILRETEQRPVAHERIYQIITEALS